ncbi:MAG: hypothetical protein ABS882_01095 [Lysinibacillus sp.]
MKEKSIGHTFILIGNVLHSFVYTMLILENIGTKSALLYGIFLLLIIPNIIGYRKLLQTKHNSWVGYFIAVGFILTIGFIGLIYIVGAFIVMLHNNRLREEERKRRVNL